MIIRKAYKYRLKTNTDLEAKLFQIAGHCRFVWNYFWKMNQYRLKYGFKILRYTEMDFFSKWLKASNEYSFLKEVPAHCLQQKLKDLDKAYSDGFDKKQILKRMPIKRKRELHSSFRFPEPKQFEIDHNRIKLPKLGWVTFFKSQKLLGNPKNVTVSYRAGHWYAAIQVEIEVPDPVHLSNKIVGLDMGIVHFVSASDGQQLIPIHPFKAAQERLAKLQRILAKKVTYSKNWRKIKAKIQRLHHKIANMRRDFLHKASTALSKSHARIVVEDLKITHMNKSAKGTQGKPGKNIKAKSGLNKSILDQGWGEFKRQLAYKLKWLGGDLIQVSPKYTSQSCSSCGHRAKENRVSQSRFICKSCGHTDHADLNAAKNILAAGHAVLACGERTLVNSMKQEPQRTSNLVPA